MVAVAVDTTDMKSVNIEHINPKSLSPHPHNIKIYGEEQISNLKERILSSRWIKPLVVTSNNVIISGHRRWRSAVELGLISVPIERRIFSSDLDELEALLLENASREKTNEQKAREGETWEYIESEKAALIQRLQGQVGREHGKEGGRPSSLRALDAKEEKPLVEPVPQGVSPDVKSKKKRAPATRDRVAAQIGLGSGKNYENVKKAVKAADILEDKGHAEEANALRQVLNNQGKGNVQAAAKVASMPEEQQIAILEKIATGEAKTVKAAELEIKKEESEAQVQAAPTKPRVTLASCDEWLSQQQTCDLLVTDPPYSTDIEDIETFAQSWLPLALSKVKLTGRAYVCIGAYPRELQAYLNVQTPLQIQQVLVWSYKNTMGPSPTYDYKQNWQAVLYFRGPDAPSLDCPTLIEQFSAQEINAPDGRQGNRYHTWQKPDELAERLIRHSTKPDDVVFDCFAGTGTFLLAAHRLGRVAHGCDSSAEMLEIAQTRGCEVIR